MHNGAAENTVSLLFPFSTHILLYEPQYRQYPFLCKLAGFNEPIMRYRRNANPP